MKRAVLVVLVLVSIGVGHAIWRHVSAQSNSVAAGGGASPTAPGGAITAAEAKEIGVAAYIFSYPLVTMHMTKKVSTNVERPKGDKAPVGQFANLRKFPTAQFRTVVAPNADTLYSAAWLDLSKEPYVFSYPYMGKRYFMFPVLDAYTNVLRTPGTRDNGGVAATYVISGPGWKGGKLPEGATEIKSPTNTVWIIGRTYSDATPEDLKAVHALQDQYALYPLSAAGQHYTPPPGTVDPRVNEKTSVREQVDAMKTADFFNAAAKAMATDKPSVFDTTIVARMAKLGIVPGQTFDMGKLPRDVASALEDVPQKGQQQIKAQMEKGLTVKNGWAILLQAGDYGMNYNQRAMVAAMGLGANKPEQAVYPTTDVDSSGQTLSGRNKYVIHFARGQTPPAKAFWSLTMYDKKMFFVPNALNRFAIQEPRDHDQIKTNPDGSLDIYVQNEKPPVEQQGNWLPAPKDEFLLMMRLYWPSATPPSVLDGSWEPPPVTSPSAAPRMGRPAGPRPRPSPQ